MCTPECGVWAPNRRAVENALTVIVIIADVIGYEGEFTFDTAKPMGMKQKLVDNTKLKQLG